MMRPRSAGDCGRYSCTGMDTKRAANQGRISNGNTQTDLVSRLAGGLVCIAKRKNKNKKEEKEGSEGLRKRRKKKGLLLLLLLYFSIRMQPFRLWRSYVHVWAFHPKLSLCLCCFSSAILLRSSSFVSLVSFAVCPY